MSFLVLGWFGGVTVAAESRTLSGQKEKKNTFAFPVCRARVFDYMYRESGRVLRLAVPAFGFRPVY